MASLSKSEPITILKPLDDSIKTIENSLSANPRELMEYIQKTVAELEIDVQKFDFDRCHRIGKLYKPKDVTYQNVVLRLRSWSARDTICKK